MPTNIKLRRQFDLKQGSTIPLETLKDIYKEYDKSHKPLVVIDRNYDDTYNRDYNYLMHGKNGYKRATNDANDPTHRGGRAARAPTSRRRRRGSRIVPERVSRCSAAAARRPICS